MGWLTRLYRRIRGAHTMRGRDDLLRAGARSPSGETEATRRAEGLTAWTRIGGGGA